MLVRYKLLSKQGKVGQGVMSADYVAVSGIAKSSNANHPYAVANELLCGRLGRSLGLPIPPGFIIEDAGTPWHVSLDFNLAGQQLPPADCASLVQSHSDLAGAIVVFDAWILNGDRHKGNISFDQSSQRINVFDHSHAFYAGTLGKNYLIQFAQSTLVHSSDLTPHLKDLNGVHLGLQRLQQLPDYMIEDAVNEASTVGLPNADIQYCIDYLKDRRDRMRSLLLHEQAKFVGVTPTLWAQF